jgi:serine protease Do
MASRRRALRFLGVVPFGACAASMPAAATTGLPDLVARIKPSVLPVGTFAATDSPRFGFRGTGFVVGDGSLVATNHHVLPPASEPDRLAQLVVMVGRQGDQAEFRRVQVVASDRSRDLALLRLSAGPALTPLALEAAAAREGQSIALMGFPIGGVLGFAAVTHRGIVASITTASLPAPSAQQLDARAVARLREGSFELLQLDATAYPGNSGGPVFDTETGRVLGVVSLVLVKSGRESALSQPTGITYAVPSAQLARLLAETASAAPQTR